MTRLIDADALCRHLSDWQYGSLTDGKHDVEYGVIENVIEGIEKEPTIEAVPVRHGKWIRVSPAKIYECSECGQNVCTGDIECYRFCHQCGARMDEDE